MTDSMLPRHWGPRLTRIELPGMQIEHDRLLFPQVDSPDAAAKERIGKEPEQPSPTDWQVRSEQASRPDREFSQAGGAASPDLVWKSQRIRLAVAIVVNRIQARIVREALLRENCV